MRSIEPPINTVFQGLRGIAYGKGKNSPPLHPDGHRGKSSPIPSTGSGQARGRKPYGTLPFLRQAQDRPFPK